MCVRSASVVSPCLSVSVRSASVSRPSGDCGVGWLSRLGEVVEQGNDFAMHLKMMARYGIMQTFFGEGIVSLLGKRGEGMAKPVKETPILFGEEARQFEVRMLHPKPLSPARVKSIQRDYEFLRKKCVNCSF